MKTFKNLMQDESGATLIEYALIAALISIAAIAAMQLLGTKISGQFNYVESQLKDS